MSEFINKILLFILYLFGFSIVMLLGYMYMNELDSGDFPAINLSNSYSFNEKMQFLKEKQANSEVLAIGSSMSLNNLHSPTVVEKLGTTSFLNTASWGVNMEETFRLLIIVEEVYKPKTIILSSGLVDFMKSQKVFRYDIVEEYLKSERLGFYYYFRTFDLKYFANNFIFAKATRSNPDNLEYLGFDEYGGVNFESNRFNINQHRWENRIVDSIELDQDQYFYLDSITTFCRMKNIELLFFQGPIRNGILSRYNEEEQQILFSHTDNVKKIILKNGGFFVNANESVWSDSLFFDNTHLSSRGAKIYTEYSFNNLKGTLTSSE